MTASINPNQLVAEQFIRRRRTFQHRAEKAV
jgi:hypothetical protein